MNHTLPRGQKIKREWPAIGLAYLIVGVMVVLSLPFLHYLA